MKVAVIGAGPCGSYIAYQLAKEHDVSLYEQESVLCGCWATKRVNGYFTEHAPRVWFDNYKNSIEFLKEIKIEFEEEFFHVHNVFRNFLSGNISNFNLMDLLYLTYLYIAPDSFHQGKRVKDVFKYFSKPGKLQLEEYCYLWDGIPPEQFSLQTFVQTFDTFLLYNMYLPKQESDIWYEPKLKQALEKRNVSLFLEHKFNFIKDRKVFVNNKEIEADAYVICIPPKPFMDVLNKSDANAKENWGKFNLLQEKVKTNYYTAVGIQFHFAKRIYYKNTKNLPHIFGNFKNSWGQSKTYMSLCILNLDAIKDLKREKVIQETWKQLNQALEKAGHSKLPLYTKATMTPGLANKNGWVSTQGAFSHSVQSPFFVDHTGCQKNLHYVGSHNPSKTKLFPVTTHESAIMTAKSFLNEQFGYSLEIQTPFKIKIYVQFLIILFVFLKVTKKI